MKIMNNKICKILTLCQKQIKRKMFKWFDLLIIFFVFRKFDNIYIGDGQKFTAYNHSPMPLQEIQEEYPLGPEIMEIADPTPEQEEEWRLAHEEKKNLGEEGEEEEEANDGDYDDEDDEEDEEEEEEE